jgi:hypothetical protein
MLQAAGGLLALLILSLAIPVNLVYALRKERGWRGRIIVYWLFGLLHVSFRPGRKPKGPRRERRRIARRRIAKAGKGLVRRRRDLRAALRTPGMVPRLIRLLRDLLRSSRPRRFRAEVVIGLEDPADTGRLWGMLAPLRFLFGKRGLGKASNISIEITPDFSGPRFQAYSCASVRLVPLKMIALLLGFVFSAPVLRAARVVLQRSSQ